MPLPTDTMTPEEKAFLDAIKEEYAKLHLLDAIKTKILEAFEAKLKEPGVATIDALEETAQRAYIQTTKNPALLAAFEDLKKKEKTPNISDDELEEASAKFNLQCAPYVMTLGRLGVSDASDDALIAHTAKKAGLKSLSDRENEERQQKEEKDAEQAKKETAQKEQQTQKELADQRNAATHGGFADEMRASGKFELHQESVTVDGSTVNVAVRGNMALLNVNGKNIAVTEDYIAIDRQSSLQPELAKTAHDAMQAMIQGGLTPDEGRQLIKALQKVTELAPDGINAVEAQTLTKMFKDLTPTR